MLLTEWRRRAAGAAGTGGTARARRISEGRREELVDQGQNDQEDEAGAEAPGDQLLLDRQQRLVCGVLELAADIVLRHATCSSEQSASPVTSCGNRAAAAGRALHAAGRSPWDARQCRDHDQQDEARGRDRNPALDGEGRARCAGEGRLLVAHARLAFFRTACG